MVVARHLTAKCKWTKDKKLPMHAKQNLEDS